MIRAATLQKRLYALAETLSQWCTNANIARHFPDNCETQFLRVEAGALRLLATANYENGRSSCWVAWEALEEKQTEPDVVVCRELLHPPRNKVVGVRHTVLHADGQCDAFDVTNDFEAHVFFSYLRGLVE